MFSQLPMISETFIRYIDSFYPAGIGGYYQVKDYRAVTVGKFAIGQCGHWSEKGKFFNGNIVMVASDG